MQKYTSKSGKPYGVDAFEFGEDHINIRFVTSPTVYTYTNRSAGLSAIEMMKKLALVQNGLSTWIAQNKPEYASKS